MREFTKKNFSCLGLAGAKEKESSTTGKQPQVDLEFFPKAGDLGGGLATRRMDGVYIGV